MIRRLTLSVLLLLAVSPLGAQSPLLYEVDLSNAAHHEARIRAVFGDLEPGVLELRMGRSSPGRYALHEFGKNVYGIEAVDGAGGELGITRPNPYQYDVAHPGGTVEVTYTLFADRADGTYSGIDRAQAHLNIPATFMFARGLGHRPVQVTFRPPAGSDWSVATQLVPTDDPMVFTAPDGAYFMDSPTHLGPLDVREWTVDDGSGHTIRVAVDHLGTSGQVDDFARDVRAIVEATRDVFGEYPDFDHGEYTFISAYLPWVSGDGMEHRNSTSLTSSGNLAENTRGLLGTVAHEFVHAWNVERIRPASLEPFDFERANMSGELWFAEGFTSYYTNLIMRRAGLLDDGEYAATLGGGISYVTHAPGRRLRSPVEMSRHAPFVDRAVSVDPSSAPNTFISYYTWGSVLGLALDLELRSRFGAAGLDLDRYMRLLWERFGRSETPYAPDDLERALADLTGDPDWASGFFARYVYGREIPDFQGLLAPAGLALRPARPGAPWVGPLQLRADPDGAVVASYTLVGSPFHAAGLDARDRIGSLDGRPVTSNEDLSRILEGRRPGDRLDLVFESRGRTVETSVTLEADPGLEVVLFEAAGAELTPAAAAFRRAWLEGPEG